MKTAIKENAPTGASLVRWCLFWAGLLGICLGTLLLAQPAPDEQRPDSSQDADRQPLAAAPAPLSPAGAARVPFGQAGDDESAAMPDEPELHTFSICRSILRPINAASPSQRASRASANTFPGCGPAWEPWPRKPRPWSATAARDWICSPPAKRRPKQSMNY